MQVSLQALKAFDAAARHGSFKLAASELALTPTAISHHVSKLEARLNTQLFVRKTRKIELTELGKRLAQATNSGFQTIAQALDEITHIGKLVNVNTTSSFAASVLLPSLAEFNAKHGDIEVAISTGESVEYNQYAVAIRLGDKRMVNSQDILQCDVFNMYRAKSAGEQNNLASLSHIYTCKWKNPDLPPVPLTEWCNQNGITQALALTQYDQELFALQQAIAHGGYVFCSQTLAKSYVARGELCELTTLPVASDLCYYIPNKSALATLPARLFCEWLSNLISA
ncbi:MULTISPECIES: LysR family transcriptional regulator [Pseudoalteromonas]|uniref:LysR family transcriptional regulator n=1 Tax=Pseudoalteromonas TaxID=53246 RepID=UPI00026CBE7D|nr:LysR family transcriptional regulator [Pseudoalteromonas spongiae]ATD01205.1 hypothetical protein PSPO_b1337 [Pseudoalteromonas spongiae UST010723-006]